MDFFKQLERVITADNPDTKFALFSSFYDDYKRGFLIPDKHPNDQPSVFSRPSFASFCTILSPDKTPPRSRISTREGRAALLHSFAHIEYNAVDLALDAVYRFRDVPESFVKDWLEVAEEEIRHFLEIRSVMFNELGTEYGDLPVHQYLFNVSMKTQDLAERMAVIPCHLEAVGLDVNPGIMQKFRNMEDPQSERIVKILQIILYDETDHVRKGLRWFRWISDKGKESAACPLPLIRKILPNAFPVKAPLNRDARLKAGFTEGCLESYQQASP